MAWAATSLSVAGGLFQQLIAAFRENLELIQHLSKRFLLLIRHILHSAISDFTSPFVPRYLIRNSSTAFASVVENPLFPFESFDLC